MTEQLRPTILLVDDHPLMRRGLRQLIETGDELDVVGEAASGEQALALQQELQPDLILLDQQMPGLSGIETLLRLRRAGYAGKVLLYTVSDDSEDVRAAMRHGADGYLLKDMEPEDLLRQLRAALAGAVVVSERLARQLDDSLQVDPLRAVGELTTREAEVLRMLVAGNSNKMIGVHLGITEGTVKVHVKNLFQKLGLRSRVEAVVWAMERLRN
ncbi:MAG: transcriptional regulator NarL [Moraxellaceae bacterium]|jgi:two-component system nitrate/nitrite response regulator NarL|nr:transcriptional regulator NarL [Moraxellaceae bacterium]